MLRNRQYAIEVDFFTTEQIETSMSFKQYDYGTSNISFLLKSKGQEIQLSEDEEIIVIFKLKNNIVANRVDKPVQGEVVASTQDDATITVDVPKKILKNQGTVHCEVVIVNKVNGNRKTSPNITFSIVKSLVDFDELLSGE